MKPQLNNYDDDGGDDCEIYDDDYEDGYDWK